MKGKLLLAILLLTPLCCVAETASDDDDYVRSCEEEGCRELGWCTYTEECQCKPATVAECQATTSCQEHGSWCCLGVNNLNGCLECQTAPSGPWGACP